LGDIVVRCEKVKKEYSIAGREDKVVALKEINVEIKANSFVMLRGASGGGKTTLLNLIGTIDKVSAGNIEVFGERVNADSKDTYLSNLRLEKIGFVFQTFNLLATMSAFENVELPMTILGKLSKKERQARAKELLTLVGLQDRMDHLPSELSGGEQQRVTIARALANEPQILLLDEPTGDLDTKNTVEVMDLLLEINNKKKTTCIMVSHNPDVECYADRILYIEDGRFVSEAVNAVQSKLQYEHYIKILNSRRN